MSLNFLVIFSLKKILQEFPLYTKNKKSNKVIRIHKALVLGKELNSRTFIGEIFNNEENEIKNIFDNNNYICAGVNIKQEYINKDIRIINSY